jgi:uncharacterized protein YlzI (FlbEa/FlbD family)
MIKVTRLNDSVLMINVEMIQSLQSTPDTVITFTNHDRLMVKEPVEAGDHVYGDPRPRSFGRPSRTV